MQSSVVLLLLQVRLSAEDLYLRMDARFLDFSERVFVRHGCTPTQWHPHVGRAMGTRLRSCAFANAREPDCDARLDDTAIRLCVS